MKIFIEKLQIDLKYIDINTFVVLFDNAYLTSVEKLTSQNISKERIWKI